MAETTRRSDPGHREWQECRHRVDDAQSRRDGEGAMRNAIAKQSRRLAHLRIAGQPLRLGTASGRAAGWRHEDRTQSVGSSWIRPLVEVLEGDTPSLREQGVTLMHGSIGAFCRRPVQRPKAAPGRCAGSPA